MHWTLTVIGCLVAWALLASPWRPGSLALAASWMIGQAWFAATGNAVPIALYMAIDPAVIAAVLIWRGGALDWLIVGIFPAEWWAYGAMQGAEQWWWLWTLAAAQMLLAGPWRQVMRATDKVSHGTRSWLGLSDARA